MSLPTELIVRVAREKVEHSNGPALDIGGSAVKVTYCHKDDWDELQQGQDQKTAKIRLRVFALDEFEEALAFLSKYCHIRREGDEAPLINITGIGGYHVCHLIKKRLNVKTQILSEHESFVKAFVELARTLPQHDLLYMRSEEQLKKLQTILTKWRAFYAVCNQKPGGEKIEAPEDFTVTVDSALPIAQTVSNLYPCLLYLVSSASIVMTVRSKDDFDFFGLNINGGGIFLGLGSVLCRSKQSYDELIDLAEKGDTTAVDDTYACYKSPPGESGENVYDTLLEKLGVDDEISNPFRGAIGKSPDLLKNEDLILSLLKTMARYHVNILLTTAMSSRTPHVFLVGSFFNRELVRNLFDEEFSRQKPFASDSNSAERLDIAIHFAKAGGNLGSLGAFLANSRSTQFPESED